MTRSFDALIVGAGHAGAQAAMALRHADFGGSVAIVGDEPDFPYERPPLSKEYFSGDKDFHRLLIRPAGFWAEQDIAMILGQRVLSVDAQARAVKTDANETIGYGTLIWAAGGSPKGLPVQGGRLPGVYGMRTRADADALKSASIAANRIVVIGGGYIGLEAAAVLAKRGKAVILLEVLERILARVAGEAISRFYEAEHRAHGVDLRLGASVQSMEGTDRVTGVRLSSGEVIEADLVIVGIGVDPAVQPLLDAGAKGGNGVQVDDFCRTSLPGVYAIGDCALHANGFADGAMIRLESVQNANDQAATAVKSLMGSAQPYQAIPWFWSNQYDLRLQTVGLSIGHDTAVTRGNPSNRSFSVIYLKKGRIIALDCVNCTKDYVQGKALVLNRSEIAPALLANTAIPLKELAAYG